MKGKEEVIHKEGKGGVYKGETTLPFEVQRTNPSKINENKEAPGTRNAGRKGKRVSCANQKKKKKKKKGAGKKKNKTVDLKIGLFLGKPRRGINASTTCKKFTKSGRIRRDQFKQ